MELWLTVGEERREVMEGELMPHVRCTVWNVLEALLGIARAREKPRTITPSKTDCPGPSRVLDRAIAVLMPRQSCQGRLGQGPRLRQEVWLLLHD